MNAKLLRPLLAALLLCVGPPAFAGSAAKKSGPLPKELREAWEKARFIYGWVDEAHGTPSASPPTPLPAVVPAPAPAPLPEPTFGQPDAPHVQLRFESGGDDWNKWVLLLLTALGTGALFKWRLRCKAPPSAG